jgi:hypothetical protein
MSKIWRKNKIKDYFENFCGLGVEIKEKKKNNKKKNINYKLEVY